MPCLDIHCQDKNCSCFSQEMADSEWGHAQEVADVHAAFFQSIFAPIERVINAVPFEKTESFAEYAEDITLTLPDMDVFPATCDLSSQWAHDVSMRGE